MKKTIRNLSFYFLLIFVLVSAVFIVNFSRLNNVNVSANVSTVKIQNYKDFMSALTTIVRENAIAENSVIFFEKDEDVIFGDNGECLVSDVKFSALTESNPRTFLGKSQAVSLLSNSERLYRLDDLAISTGYNVTTGDHNMVLTKQFATKRLIVETQNSTFDKHEAVAVINFDNLYVLQFDNEFNTRDAYNYYSNCADITSVSVDGLCWVEKDVEPEQQLTPLGLTDTFSYESWGVAAMGVPEYSQYIVDVLNANNNNYTKLPEVVVAVLDTGIDTDHPWFKDRLLVGDDGKYIGMDYTGVNKTGYAFEDDDSHGTHCSGIICDMTLPNVKILPIKFLSTDESANAIGSTLGLYNAIEYLYTMCQTYNIAAINMSFGMESNFLTNNLHSYLVSIFQSFYNCETFCVVAAGNEMHDDVVNYLPAKIENAITVSALNPNLTLANYSNIGNLVDVAAPGSSINSAYVDGATDFKSGTSMAAPHVAGYIALLKSDPMHNYTMAEIEQILSGTYKNTPTILDLGNPGKDSYYGYGMPIFDGLIPEYVTVDVQSGAHGTASLDGFNLFMENEPVTVEFYPDERYYVSAVYLDDTILPDVNHVTSYTITNPSKHHNLKVEFATEEVAYIVNHYIEPIYDLNNLDTVPDYQNYNLYESETLYTRLGFLTEGKAKDYTGFTVIEFEQITVTDSTTLNIYYKRNKYKITIQQPSQGFVSIIGAGEYLFGDTVEIIPTLEEKYNWYIWKISEDILINGFNESIANQTFEMPATDITLTAYPTLKTYLVTVKIVGKGIVTPNSKSVTYGEDISFIFKPDKNYAIKTVTCDDVVLELDDNTYQLSNVTSDVELLVYFERTVPEEKSEGKIENPKKNLLDITVWGGGSVVALFLFGGSVLFLMMAFRKPRI